MSSQRAVNLREAYRISDVKPLEGDALDRYYTKLGESRKSEAVTNMSAALDLQEPGEFSTILFAGHRGCVKSTELRRLERDLRKQYHVIFLPYTRLAGLPILSPNRRLFRWLISMSLMPNAIP
jgi:hypothetical protein